MPAVPLDLLSAPLGAPLLALVVDDDPSMREIASQMLRALGLTVIAARGGEEALGQIAQQAPNLVVTDLRMPEIDGAKLLVKIKRDNPSIPVVVMSVVDSVEQAVELLQSGADDYWTKPLSFDLVKARVEALAERLSLLSDRDELEALVRFAFDPGEDFILGPSDAILKVAAKLPGLARTDAPVIILGESGTGKELVARAVHSASRRARCELVSVSCATIPDNLWEREFFGHVKGAFSDSGDGAPGLARAAEGGTLFLDEVGEIPLPMQAKLLRFLQEKEFRAVGSTKLQRADVRVVSATNRDLLAEVQAGRFRQDLYYRLAVIPVEMPALRERKADIPSLAEHFIRRYAAEFAKPVVGLSHLALQKLCSHDYPGNVRELENVVQQALVATRHNVISADDVPAGDATITELRPQDLAEAPAPQAAAATPPADVDPDVPYNEAKQRLISKFESSYARAMLDRHGGNVSRAATAAGLARKSFSRIMARHELTARTNGRGED